VDPWPEAADRASRFREGGEGEWDVQPIERQVRNARNPKRKYISPSDRWSRDVVTVSREEGDVDSEVVWCFLASLVCLRW
jgi:hypothetical protein